MQAAHCEFDLRLRWDHRAARPFESEEEVKRLIVLAAAFALLAAGCGGDDGVSVDDPWARNSPRMANAGAIYMDLESGDGDRLIGAAVDASIAGKVEIHETAMVEGEMGEESEEGMGGAMMMQEVGEIALPAGETVKLEPGGYHIMLLDISTPLELGETFDVTLTFENAGEQVVEVEVREEAP
jgi:copper(I)-binding protein